MCFPYDFSIIYLFKVQIVTNDELTLLDMKMSCSPEGDLEFGVLRKNGQQ